MNSSKGDSKMMITKAAKIIRKKYNRVKNKLNNLFNSLKEPKKLMKILKNYKSKY